MQWASYGSWDSPGNRSGAEGQKANPLGGLPRTSELATALKWGCSLWREGDDHEDALLAIWRKVRRVGVEARTPNHLRYRAPKHFMG